MKIKELECRGQPAVALEVARRGMRGAQETGGTTQAEARGVRDVLGQRKGEPSCQGFGRLRPFLRQPLSTGGVWVTGWSTR